MSLLVIWINPVNIYVCVYVDIRLIYFVVGFYISPRVCGPLGLCFSTMTLDVLFIYTSII